MTDPNQYDVAITGGGLAGLALCTQLATAGYKVILFEKETYPFHRVCGEYISMESWDFLKRIGIDVEKEKPSHINKLLITSTSGRMLKTALPLGGFGISRFRLDHLLAIRAREVGAIIMEDAKVSDIVFDKDQFVTKTSDAEYRSGVAIGSFGKRANLDIRWERKFIDKTRESANNYVGIKYHLLTDFDQDTIALHHFQNGYCGLVKIEGDKFSCCYLTSAKNLRDFKGDIQAMEDNLLSKNPFLHTLLKNSEKVSSSPLTISQISFERKEQVSNHILLTGDAAGMITPLCGNGMSMALHGSKIAFEALKPFLEGKSSRKEMEDQYSSSWNKQFGTRLNIGRRVQALSLNSKMTEAFVAVGKLVPGMVRSLISKTHGSTF